MLSFFSFLTLLFDQVGLRIDWLQNKKHLLPKGLHSFPEAGFLVRVHPEPCLILSRAQIRALLCSSKSKFIPA
jgi:hypothetical protein